MGTLKKINRIKYFVFVLLYIASLFAYTVFSGSSKVYAFTAADFVVYPGTDANAVNKAYTYTGLLGPVTGDSYFNNQALNNISILAKDFAGEGNLNLAYDSQLSDDFGRDKQAGTDALPGAGELFFTTTYFCNASSGAIQTKPFGDINQYAIKFAVGLYKVTGEFAAQDSYTVAMGPVLVSENYSTSSGKSDKQIFDIKTTKEFDHQVNPDQLDDHVSEITGQGVPKKCFPASIVGSGTKIKNYNKLNEDQKKDFAEAASKASSSSGSGDTGSGGSSDSCVTSDSGPLGWVICPIIDLASTFSQGVYTHFIQPFLEDVPVSTDPNDGAYTAWKSFRLIGNIVLVGTMLAVVYSQIRGDR